MLLAAVEGWMTRVRVAYCLYASYHPLEFQFAWVEWGPSKQVTRGDLPCLKIAKKPDCP